MVIQQFCLYVHKYIDFSKYQTSFFITKTELQLKMHCILNAQGKKNSMDLNYKPKPIVGKSSPVLTEASNQVFSASPRKDDSELDEIIWVI